MLQRTFEISHLKDYLRSAEGIHMMFAQLGYDVYDPEPIDADDIDMSEGDAQHVQAVYLINGMDFGHTIWLFEVDDTAMVRLRGLAYDVLQRPGTHTLIVTKDYREIIITHPYFVGGTKKSHTRVNKLKIDSRHPTRHDVDTINALLARGRKPEEIYKSQKDAFSVTRVTNKFYREYRDYFHRAQDVVVEWNKGIAEFQNSDQRDKLHAFVQRLMGRLMFLYFLQRKGWLGDRKDFLTWQYRQMVNRHAGELSDESSYYYREVLEPLFFETLNRKRPDDWTQWKVKIPYLNGGLFDKSRDPEGVITLPDSLFDPNSNTGLLAFFNRYNFTITDDAPMEQDVAVDPEMLGKVFENMLEEEDRGQSGSFYTPRTIVSYMCQEALAGYLEESAGISREETRRHFDPDDDITFTPEQAGSVSDALDTLTVLDPAVGSGSFLIGMLNEIITLRHKVAAALNQTVTPELIAAWKEAIIRDTLYGVDIKPGAIEIAQLRLWLSLVVNQTMADAKPLPNLDYKLMAGNSLIETIDGEPILSESARQMLNSAAKPLQPKLFDMSDAGDEKRKLEDLRNEYFHATPEERTQLAADIRFQERRIIEAGLNDMLDTARQRIKALEQKYSIKDAAWRKADAKKYADLLARVERLNAIKRDLWSDEATLPFFLYRLHFNDVFANKGGFDVVVANPPYVRQELIRDQKPDLQASYPDVYAGTADLFVYFFSRALNLLRANGHLSFITPNKFMRANYGKKLRGFLAKKARLHTLIDFGDLPIFDATTYPMITIASKSALTLNPSPNRANAPGERLDSPLPVPQERSGEGAGGEGKIKVLEITALDESETLHAAAERAYSLPQSTLGEDGWQLSAPEIRALMDKLKASGKPLGEYVDGAIYYGIKTGLNEAFIIDEAKRAELIADDPKSAEVIKPYLRGRDVKRWNVQPAGLYIIFTRRGINIEEYPAIKAHLEQFRADLTPKQSSSDKRGRKPGRYKWYEIQDDIAYYAEFEKPKILSARFMESPLFGFDGDSHYTNDACYLFPGNLFVLALLNSPIGWFFITRIATLMQNRYYQIHIQYLEQIPIPDAPDDLRGKIAALAQGCLDAAKDDPDALPALEAELNQLVYQAYGLDADDIRVIEGHLGGDDA
ncbi:MAG: type II restriction endonuclease [Anaerolineaceae bacterium]|nr:MAG: type II restriction endonuclease [Anaerolineaceae bacterium]